ncbi:Ger(x)C family spore germination protein [Bacillus sp. 31A1R]|uniref:Ger(X)C family spore germination protein n=1 Tax=Robertmurraya mangrovi TaxID=3098077 RepID=A0ABU5ISM8_9BACI|nr:Ger(x)C family spore germination protein [Bacillus sp. 31A1R]MDZ5470162.1 Ger(x)C family spore germination protein [Bacillus sp. 31A1R]
MRHKLHYPLLIIIFMSGLLTGCGFKDIDKRIFVTNIGIDRSTDEKELYKVTLRLAIPSGNIKQGQDQEYVLLVEDNMTISHAVRKMKSEIDKELDFAHAKVIILGEDVVDENLYDIIDWLARRRDIQKIAWITMAKGTAEDILKARPKSERLASEALINIFDKIGTESPYIHSEYFSEFRRDLYEKGIDAVFPVIDLKKSEDKNETYSINKVAIYRAGEEWKVVNLDPEETRIFNMLKDFEQNVGFVIDTEKEKFLYATDIIKIKYKLTDQPKPKITYDIMMQGILEEKEGVFKQEKVKQYNKLIEQEVKKQIEDLLNKLKEENVDPIGFGVRYKSTRFTQEDRIEKWNRLYPDVLFDIKVKAMIKSSGVTE